MDELELEYGSADEVPEQFGSLYTEDNGVWRLTAVRGMKTQADIDRLNNALRKEREEHKGTKERFSPFAELGELDDVRQKLERIPELEAAAGDKLDEAKLAEMAAKRAEPIINREVGKLQRELEATRSELEESRGTLSQFREKETRRTISDEIRSAALSEGIKLREEAIDDAIVQGLSLFEVGDDGVFTKAESPLGAGIDPKAWLLSLTATKPHWFRESRGAGARSGGGGGIANNPWSKDHWNLTRQAQIVKEHGMERAGTIAAAVGAKVGSTRPQASRGR